MIRRAEVKDLPSNRLKVLASKGAATTASVGFALDFESFANWEELSLPWTYKGVVFSESGPSTYRALIHDVSTVLPGTGPRSLGLLAEGFSPSLRLDLQTAQRFVWLSLLKISNNPIVCTVFEADGKKRQSNLAFDPSDSDGTYRTFDVGSSATQTITAIELFGGALVRIAGRTA